MVLRIGRFGDEPRWVQEVLALGDRGDGPRWGSSGVLQNRRVAGGQQLTISRMMALGSDNSRRTKNADGGENVQKKLA